MPEAEHLLLKRLLILLQNITRNSATSKMTATKPAIYVVPNQLSPAEEHTPPLDVLGQVTAKVRCGSWLPTAFWARLSLAGQRDLAASILQPVLKGQL